MAKIPVKEFKSEIEIKKSKFIGIGFPIDSPEHAREKLKSLRNEYPDARHICYAFLWGKKSTHMGMSDDGEPSGTAGRPMLEVLKGSGYENILVAAVRYFGGIKLGTGGLVKAYTEITQNVIRDIEVEEFVEKIKLNIKFTYSLYEPIKKLILSQDGIVLHEDFSSDIELNFDIPVINRECLEKDILDISNGSVLCRISQ